MSTIPGSCLCGGVRYEVLGTPETASHCHCSRCRKQTGTFGTTSLRVRSESIRLLAGEGLLGTWQPAPDAGIKVFCTRCGSSLFGGQWPDGPIVSVRMGCVDADPGVRPERHIYTASAAPWFPVPDDGLPRFEEGSDAGDPR
jgi:hypothetical protein